MRVGSFSVQVPEAHELSTGHAQIQHDTQYRIRLGNHGNRRCDAAVEVDGKPIGQFRINGGGYMTLERPSHDTGKFTFFKATSDKAAQAGVDSVEKDNRGLIRVIFHVEKIRERPIGILRGAGGQHQNMTGERMEYTSGRIKGLDSGCVPASAGQIGSAGITGLTGASGQQFVEVSALEYDDSLETTVTLRLVSAEPAVRPLTPVENKNPVPAAVE